MSRSLNGCVDIVRLRGDYAAILQQSAENRCKLVLLAEKRQMPDACAYELDHPQLPHGDAILVGKRLLELIGTVSGDFDEKFLRPMGLVIEEPRDCGRWLLA